VFSVPLMLHLHPLRTLISIVILIAGAIVFGCDTMKFTAFSMCSVPGNTVIAFGLFLIGGSLWIGD
jgi:hypothetical protein